MRDEACKCWSETGLQILVGKEVRFDTAKFDIILMSADERRKPN